MSSQETAGAGTLEKALALSSASSLLIGYPIVAWFIFDAVLLGIVAGLVSASGVYLLMLWVIGMEFADDESGDCPHIGPLPPNIHPGAAGFTLAIGGAVLVSWPLVSDNYLTGAVVTAIFIAVNYKLVAALYE